MADIETWRGVVHPSECDVLGHMNVSRYFGICGDGVFCFQTMLGLGPSEVRNGRRLSFAVVHAESDFFAELHAGDVLYLKTGVAEIGGKTATFRHRLYRMEDEKLSFETTFRGVLLDLETRRAATVPDDVRQEMAKYMVAPA